MENSSDDRLSSLEQKLALLETYSIQAFWTALDRAYEATLAQRELTCIVFVALLRICLHIYTFSHSFFNRSIS